MAKNGKSNVPLATTANQERRGSMLFTDLEARATLEYATDAGKNFPNASTVTPDVPAVSKMDSINGGKKSMQVLKWLGRQAYSVGLLALGIIGLGFSIVVVTASIAIGWQLGLAFAIWTLGG